MLDLEAPLFINKNCLRTPSAFSLSVNCRGLASPNASGVLEYTQCVTNSKVHYAAVV